MRGVRICLVLLSLGVGLSGAAAQGPASEGAGGPPAESPAAEPAALKRELFTGQVVLLEEALTRRGISFLSEVAKQPVLETPAGELIPILSDWRGRAFFQDERLRHRRVELVGFRRPGIPYLQVLMVFTEDDKGTRMFMDYWCDVCAIAMYEIKACECCQGDTRLRFQKQELPADVRGNPTDKQ